MGKPVVDVPTTKAPTSPEEVEAEFERITGIKVEPVLPRGYNASQLLAEQLRQKQPPTETSESKASRAKARHEKLINDFLDRDLASYLCDIDEELKAKIDALP